MYWEIVNLKAGFLFQRWILCDVVMDIIQTLRGGFGLLNSSQPIFAFNKYGLELYLTCDKVIV